MLLLLHKDGDIFLLERFLLVTFFFITHREILIKKRKINKYKYKTLIILVVRMHLTWS